MSSADQQQVSPVVETFESGGFWSCRQLNKWLLIIVTLAVGIALGADVIYESLTSAAFPWGLVLAGALSVGCVILLWVCVTYAVPAGLAILALSLFVDGIAYSIILALLLTALTALSSTKRFRRGALAMMVVWGAALGATMPDPATGTLLFLSIGVSLLAAYGIGSSFRQATTARLQSKQDLEQAEANHRKSVAAERKSIARDLHDIVAHDITIIAMQSRAARMRDTEDSYREAVSVIGDSSRAALNDLRRMLALLKDEDIVDDDADTSSASELEVFRGCEAFAARLESLGIIVEKQITGDLSSLSRSTSAALYRMLQECTTNVAKYADEGDTCWITIDIGIDQVSVEVTNTVRRARRRGAGPWSGSSGAGLIGVRDRAQAFGGNATYGYTREGHWQVKIHGVKKS
ncbi:hypothetical protein HGQ17_06485 [Nesterenkonia sp. MY13]|uniref:histidine kinase n=1 Tax=Nesterenkonia sedimenti TaxID=1463632 RepID=A0A7X8TJ15_9MICC|nr:histidine kinase [Nesterenkonia sedimenti]NLS09657.1 hypothetical protein [Nesterenkonia sedimenti]